MKALFDSIFVKWLASDLTEQLTELYYTKADDKGVMPYATVQMVIGKATDFATNEHFTDNWLVQFNLFDDAKRIDDLWIAFATLTDTFDSKTLAVTGYNFLSCRREDVLQTKEEGVWQINVIYRVRVRK